MVLQMEAVPWEGLEEQEGEGVGMPAEIKT
jgi:hypothetical protein